MTINIDFDGTCTAHDFPRVGKDIGAQKVLLKLIEKGHQLILFTVRSDKSTPHKSDDDPSIHTGPGQYLTDAIKWFEKNNIPLYGIQTNPSQASWTESPKSYAQLMIDDSAIGCPLVFDSKISSRPFADWDKIEQLLIEKEII